MNESGLSFYNTKSMEFAIGAAALPHESDNDPGLDKCNSLSSTMQRMGQTM